MRIKAFTLARIVYAIKLAQIVLDIVDRADAKIDGVENYALHLHQTMNKAMREIVILITPTIVR